MYLMDPAWVSLFGAILAYVFLNVVRVDIPNKEKSVGIRPKPEVQTPELYVMYKTADQLADLWHDPNAVGECSECGMDDAPCLMKGNFPFPDTQVCKFCQELRNLEHHLKYKTQGRWGKYIERKRASSCP